MPTKRIICARGHLRVPENLIGRDCKACHALRERKRRTHCIRGHKRSPENLTANRTCKICAIARAQTWNRSHQSERERNVRRSLLKTRYKLTEEKYDALLVKQQGVCAVCKKPPAAGRLFVVDHDHSCCPGFETCGKCLRGLIHQSCNVALGAFGDSAEICRNAVQYLENPPAQNL